MFIRLENLQVYQLAEQLADNIWNVAAKWEPFAKFTVGEQLVRAADSIAANIAEGHGRFSSRENIRFCYIARGSLNETRNWLRRAARRKLLTEEQAEPLCMMVEQLGRKLNAYIHAIRRYQFSEQTFTS